MRALAQKTVQDESFAGWYTGLIIGFVIVAVVVVLVGAILMYASRIADQAKDGIGRMDEARATTLPVWEIQDLNESATGIWQAAESARELLKEKIR
jgi:hypothetical protein